MSFLIQDDIKPNAISKITIVRQLEKLKTFQFAKRVSLISWLANFKQNVIYL